MDTLRFACKVRGTSSKDILPFNGVFFHGFIHGIKSVDYLQQIQVD